MFDSDPWPDQNSEDNSRYKGAIVTTTTTPIAVTRDPVLAYYVPKSKRRKLNEDVGMEVDAEEGQEFDKIREYTYDMWKPTKFEPTPYFFVFQDEMVTFSVMKTRVSLHRVAKEAGQSQAAPTETLVVKKLDSLSDVARQQREAQRKILDDQNAQDIY